MKKEIIAIALAGGVGNRFWPIATDKMLFPFMKSTIFDHAVIQRLPKIVSRLVIVANPTNVSVLKNIRLPIPHTTVVQEHATGMAGALMMAKELIAGRSLLIIISDNLVKPELYKEVLKQAKESNAFAVFPGWRPRQYFPGGYFILKGGKPIGIVEKPGSGNEPGPYVNISGHYIDDADILLETIQKTRSDRDDVYEKAISELMKHMDVRMIPYSGSCVSLKYPWHVLDVMDVLFADGLVLHKGRNVEIRSNVVIDGPVYLGDNVKIYENTKIVGPCYIGDQTIIGNNVMIRQSHIGANCVIGFGCDITRSFIGDNCWFHGNYVGDSVLEANVSIGSGSVLANLRLDEENIRSMVGKEIVDTGRIKLGSIIGRNVRIGVNTSIMPGVKIGNDSMIGAGVVLAKDLPEESFCLAQPGYTVSRNTKSFDRQKLRVEFRKKLE